jgi:predicted metal-dependent hydrolase
MNIQVIKSRRRTIGIEVHADGKVIVRTPLRMSSAEINRFIEEHDDWIRQKLDFVRQKSGKSHYSSGLMRWKSMKT